MICDESRGDAVRVQLHLVVVMDVKVGQMVVRGASRRVSLSTSFSAKSRALMKSTWAGGQILGLLSATHLFILVTMFAPCYYLLGSRQTDMTCTAHCCKRLAHNAFV